MAAPPDDARPDSGSEADSEADRPVSDDSAARKGGYGERSPADEADVEAALRQVERIEHPSPGPADAQGMNRADVPHSSTRTPQRESLADDAP